MDLNNNDHSRLYDRYNPCCGSSHTARVPRAHSMWWGNVDEALLAGDSRKFFKLIEDIEVSQARDAADNTLLHYVALNGNIEMASHLMINGCNVNDKNMFGAVPLKYALISNNTSVARYLLESGASHDSIVFRRLGSVVMQQAVMGRNLVYDYCCSLEHNLINVEISEFSENVDYATMSPLHMAILYYSGDCLDNYHVIEALVEAGANLQVEGPKLLNVAIMLGRENVVRLLLQAGVPVNVQDIYQTSPLFNAVIYSRLSIAKLLLSAGANPEWVDYRNRDCLYYAAKALQPEMLELLLERVRVPETYEKSNNPLRVALTWSMACLDHVPEEDKYDDFFMDTRCTSPQDHFKCIEMLLNYCVGTNSEYDDENDELPLIARIVECGTHRILDLLLSYGQAQNFDFANPYNRMVIDNLCNRSMFKRVHELIRHVARIEVEGKEGGPQNFFFDEQNDKVKEIYQDCMLEFTKMQSAEVEGSGVTYFEIFKCGNRRFYARNELIVEKFDRQDVATRFPIYGDILNRRFFEQKTEQELKDAAVKGLDSIVPFGANAFPVVYDRILDNLNYYDLKNLSAV